jgi:outer membrane protein assembly factor BamD
MLSKMSLRIIHRSLLLVCLFVLSGCFARQQNPALLEPDDLHARAEAAFQARNFGRAAELYEVFVLHHHGDPRAPEARLNLGTAYQERREYVTAATHFQRLITDFPQSPLGLAARMGICESYYRLSPRPALDQEYTVSGILHCESVAQYYPGTDPALRATGYVTEMRMTLARKAYETGMFYLRRRAFDAAVVYFQQVVDQFPQTELAPAALLQMAETYTRQGYVEDAQEARERLLRDYPTSPEAQGLRA